MLLKKGRKFSRKSTCVKSNRVEIKRSQRIMSWKIKWRFKQKFILNQSAKQCVASDTKHRHKGQREPHRVCSTHPFYSSLPSLLLLCIYLSLVYMCLFLNSVIEVGMSDLEWYLFLDYLFLMLSDLVFGVVSSLVTGIKNLKELC